MQRNSTIGELMERKRIQDGAKEYQGHTYMDLARFDEATKHMIIFDVLTDESPVGWKGERNRLYLSDVGYQKALDNQKAGNIKIISHAAVAKGNLYYDHRDMARYSFSQCTKRMDSRLKLLHTISFRRSLYAPKSDRIRPIITMMYCFVSTSLKRR